MRRLFFALLALASVTRAVGTVSVVSVHSAAANASNAVRRKGMRKLLAALAGDVMSHGSMRETVIFSAFFLSVLVWIAFWVEVGRLAAR
jgi:hypothetical protein